MKESDPSTWYDESDKRLTLLRELAFDLIDDNDFTVEIGSDEEKVTVYYLTIVIGEVTVEGGSDPWLCVYLPKSDAEENFTHADEAVEFILDAIGNQ